MTNYKNQKRIYIDEDLGKIEHHSDKDEQFLIALNWDALLNIMTDLEPPEFMLWEYILKWRGPRKNNNNQRYYDFSPADLAVNFGWSENSSRKYFKSLEKKEYIVNKKNFTYTFVPYPDSTDGRAAIKRENNRKKTNAAD